MLKNLLEDANCLPRTASGPGPTRTIGQRGQARRVTGRGQGLAEAGRGRKVTGIHGGHAAAAGPAELSAPGECGRPGPAARSLPAELAASVAPLGPRGVTALRPPHLSSRLFPPAPPPTPPAPLLSLLPLDPSEAAGPRRTCVEEAGQPALCQVLGTVRRLDPSPNWGREPGAPS